MTVVAVGLVEEVDESGGVRESIGDRCIPGICFHTALLQENSKL